MSDHVDVPPVQELPIEWYQLPFLLKSPTSSDLETGSPSTATTTIEKQSRIWIWAQVTGVLKAHTVV